VEHDPPPTIGAVHDEVAPKTRLSSNFDRNVFQLRRCEALVTNLEGAEQRTKRRRLFWRSLARY
jgi:hypothetical protein